jgi:hypothetical protein
LMDMVATLSEVSTKSQLHRTNPCRSGKGPCD